MTLHLYDSATRTTSEFVPRTPGHVGIYVCGATVQDAPHIGHLRSAVAFDILIRWLRRSGYEVTFIRNVTDIDDKILTKSAEHDTPWWAWAYRFEGEFRAAYDALGITPPTYEPRATGHVTEMVSLMELLIERGHAYTGDEGNVYFDVHSYPDYGALTRQSLENLPAEEDGAAATDKRDPRDFALWKAIKPGEPASAAWPTPFGVGRPGWHLECSAMAHRYLGEDFDIHGGGVDLRFPHHENEQAQSRAAGWGFTNWWMHNAWVTVAGEKMSKSLGNSLLVSEILTHGTPVALRYALGAVHYRSTIEFTPGESLDVAQAAWERISSFIARAGVADIDVDRVELPAAFVGAMDDDLNVSAALAVVHERVRAGNAALTAGDVHAAHRAGSEVRAMMAVLGLDPHDPHWATQEPEDSGALGVLVEPALAERAQARKEKNWSRADEIRDLLSQAGITIEDGAHGARWSVRNVR